MSHFNKQVAAVGGFILLIGFLAFIWGCRELFVFKSSYDTIAVSKVNPSASCFIAAITSLFINRYFGEKWSLFVAINGVLAGMVSCPIARHTCTFTSHYKNDVLHKRHIMKFFGNSNNSFKDCVVSNLDYGTDYKIIRYFTRQDVENF